MDIKDYKEPKIESQAKTDILLIILSATILYLFLLFTNYDLFEITADYVKKHDAWELDEIVIVGLFLTVCFAVYAWRRLREVRAYEGFLQRQNQELKKALQEIKTLQGLVPICACCKKIRDDKGYWHQVESYLSAHTSADFTHSICPECAQRLYPELNISRPGQAPSLQGETGDHP